MKFIRNLFGLFSVFLVATSLSASDIVIDTKAAMETARSHLERNEFSKVCDLLISIRATGWSTPEQILFRWTQLGVFDADSASMIVASGCLEEEALVSWAVEYLNKENESDQVSELAFRVADAFGADKYR